MALGSALAGLAKAIGKGSAPIAEEAKKASAVSIQLGIYAATVSFFLIPILFKYLDTLTTSFFRSFHVLFSLCPLSLIKVMATE